MMGKTHIVCGIATAALLSQPKTMGEFLGAILGGAVGGAICDIDVGSNSFSRDALHSRIIAAYVAGLVLLLDVFLQTGIWNYILTHRGRLQTIGFISFFVLCILGSWSRHRTFPTLCWG